MHFYEQKNVWGEKMQIFACKHTAYYDRTIFHLIRKNFGGVSHKNNLKFFENNKTYILELFYTT